MAVVRRVVACCGVFVLTLIAAACRDGKPSEKELSDAATRRIAEAKLRYDHGLAEDAKRQLLEITLEEKMPANSRADALYWLATIAGQEGRFAVAADDLERLAKDFPASPRAKGASAMLAQLRQVVTAPVGSDIESPVAKTYLRNGDFWGHEEDGWMIDSSWLPKEEMAIEWYDRVILQFPKTAAAEEAHAKKVLALLGWEERGVYEATRFGARRSPDYLPRAEKAFEAFKAEFPNSGALQAIRYQIGQAYWGHRQWQQARKWFSDVVAARNGGSDFYAAVAEKRLKKIEF